MALEIAEWFDVTDTEHLRAYADVIFTGNWPEGFIPEGIRFPPGWTNQINSLLAGAYIELMLKEREK